MENTGVHPVDVPLRKAMVCVANWAAEPRKCVARFDAKNLQLISNKWYRGGSIKPAGKR